LKTIIITTASPYIGGAERSLLEFIKHKRDQSYKYIILFPNYGPLYDELVKYDVILKKAPIENGISYNLTGIINFINYQILLFYLIFRNRPRLIYSNTGASAVFSAFPAKISRIPLITHVRDLHKFTKWGRILLGYSKVIIANSIKTKELLLSLGIKNKIFVIYNGVDLSQYNVLSNCNFRRGILNVSDEFCLIGLIGVIAPNKKSEEFIYIADTIHRQYPKTKFVIVGDIIDNRHIPYKNHIIDLIKELNLQDIIIMLGFRNNMPEIYQSLDIIVHLCEDEAFGRVIIEAMASKKPIVAKNAGGISEIILDNITGFLIDSKNAESNVRNFSDKITDLLNNYELRIQLGENGQKRVKEHFNANKYSSQIEEILTSEAK